MTRSVVIAPDSFKGSIPARDVARAIADGWTEVRPQDILTLLPQADGGEGTLDAIEGAVPGSVRHVVASVTGPDGRPVTGAWLELPGSVAVVELAQMSGLPLMAELDPLGATTTGLGEVIRAAIDAGARALVIGLGGSASTDGAAGALVALGLSLRASDDSAIAPGGIGLLDLASIDASALVPAPVGGVTVLTDVTAPLLGPEGAAAVFGPQKGASPADVAVLDSALARFASLLGGDVEAPGSGAAGGSAYGFAAAWNATIEPGADYLARLSGLSDALSGADILITGEGRFDATSLTGKVVGQLIASADAHGVRVGVVAGQVAAEPTTASGAPIWTASLTDLAGSVDLAMSNPTSALRAAGRRAALDLA